MEYFFDILLARVNLFLIALLSVIYILRKFIQGKSYDEDSFLYNLNKFLRKHHIKLGVSAIILSLVHGLLSVDLLSLNFGTFTWFLMILLGLSWLCKHLLRERGWIYYHRVITLLLIGSLVMHVTEVGGFTSDILNFSSEKNPIEDKASLDNPSVKKDAQNQPVPAQFKDGTYTGRATGYRPGLVVDVTITHGKIANIVVVSHNERDPKHYSYAMQKVPEDIIKRQSTAVDGVSGATRTSNGIKNAVMDALNKAATQ